MRLDYILSVLICFCGGLVVLFVLERLILK